MDGEDILNCSLAIIGCCGVMLIGGVIIHGLFITPFIVDNAQSTCVESGFETYISFKGYPLSKEPRALYCGSYEERMIKEGRIKAYTTSNNSNMIISDMRSTN